MFIEVANHDGGVAATCERMMVATPPTPPVAPETRTGPLSGLTPPLSIACIDYGGNKDKEMSDEE